MVQQRLLLSVLAVLLLLGAAACASAPTPTPTVPVPTPMPEPTLNPDGDAAHGELLFAQWRCADCHGDDAGGRVGPQLARTNLNRVTFTDAVRQTRPPKPAFSESELSAADVLDIYTWLQTLERAQPAGNAPALAEGEILGMSVYTESGCDACHGAFAQGGPEAGALVSYSADADTFIEAMRSTTADVPEHDLELLDEALMRRLHRWLKEGAGVDSGC